MELLYVTLATRMMDQARTGWGGAGGQRRMMMMMVLMMMVVPSEIAPTSSPAENEAVNC